MTEQNLEKAIEAALQNVIGGTLLAGGLVTTAIIIGAVLLARTLLIRQIKGKSEILDKDQRRWINRVKSGSFAFIVIALIFIWAPQIQTFALSLTAVAVAIVITTKELLMCLTGGFMRATSHAFKVGDWVTIDNMTGEVMEINTLSTRLEEIDTKTNQFSGRTVNIPNSKFLSAIVENANFQKHYIYHTVQVALQYNDLDPAQLQKTFETIVTAHYAPYQENARKFNKKVERKAAVDFADAEAEYGLRTTDLGHYIFSARLFVPTAEAGAIDSHIVRGFSEAAHKMRLKAKKDSEKQDKAK